MSISWLNYLPGIAMLAVGFGTAALWYIIKRAKPIMALYFLLGALLWAVAIAPKYLLDYTITTPAYVFLAQYFAPVVMLILLSLYVGLRTGFFESGFSYLILKYAGIAQRMGFNEAVMAGIGFGGMEAIFFGAQWLLGANFLFVVPDNPLSYLGAFERLFALFCHVFATVLVVYAINRKDLRMLWLSIAYKTVLDASIYPFQYVFGKGLEGSLILEGFVAVMGVLGLLGLYWMSKKYAGGPRVAPEAGTADTGH